MMLRFNANPDLITAEAAGDGPARIAGIAVPWDTVATVSDGTKVQFSRGAFNTGQKPAKLVENHDLTQLRGIVNSLVDGDEGLEFEATLADTTASRDAVALLKAGAYDSVSVGANPLKFTTDAEGVMTVTEAALIELSLVAVAAFSEAVITEIAAESPPDADEGEQDQQDNDNTEQESEDMSDAEIAAEPIEAEATIPTQPMLYAAKPALPTAVEYLSAYFKGGAEFDKVQRSVRAAAPEVGTADTPGILPTPILGPAYNGYVGTRPVCDAIGVRAMPGGGKVFIRPKVTTHTSMGGQASEFDTLTQGTFVVDDIQVTKATYGGYVNISEQDLDWTDPAVLNLILEDMGRIYAATTENVAADNLVSGSTNTQAFGDEPADLSDPAKWSTWIAEAAKDVVSNSDGNLPTHLFVSPDIWGYLLALSDTADRPLFPQLGPMNAVGQLGPQTFAGNAFGLSVVVSRWFANLTLIMGNADGYEIYEQQKGAITTDNPTELSRTLAWRGYFATCMLDAGKFVKATFT